MKCSQFLKILKKAGITTDSMVLMYTDTFANKINFNQIKPLVKATGKKYKRPAIIFNVAKAIDGPYVTNVRVLMPNLHMLYGDYENSRFHDYFSKLGTDSWVSKEIFRSIIFTTRFLPGYTPKASAQRGIDRTDSFYSERDTTIIRQIDMRADNAAAQLIEALQEQHIGYKNLADLMLDQQKIDTAKQIIAIKRQAHLLYKQARELELDTIHRMQAKAKIHRNKESIKMAAATAL